MASEVGSDVIRPPRPLEVVQHVKIWTQWNTMKVASGNKSALITFVPWSHKWGTGSHRILPPRPLEAVEHLWNKMFKDAGLRNGSLFFWKTPKPCHQICYDWMYVDKSHLYYCNILFYERICCELKAFYSMVLICFLLVITFSRKIFHCLVCELFI